MYGHSGEDTNPNFPSDKEKALHQYVDIDLQISHRHNVFHRTAELYAILIFVDMIKLAHASVYDSGELFVFIGSFIFIEFILAAFFKYHSRRLLALEKKVGLR